MPVGAEHQRLVLFQRVCGQREQRALPDRSADQLDAGREAIVALIERQADGGQSGDVGDRRVRGEQPGAPEVSPWVGPAPVYLARLQRARSQRGRQHRVEPVEPSDDPA